MFCLRFCISELDFENFENKTFDSYNLHLVIPRAIIIIHNLVTCNYQACKLIRESTFIIFIRLIIIFRFITKCSIEIHSLFQKSVDTFICILIKTKTCITYKFFSIFWIILKFLPKLLRLIEIFFSFRQLLSVIILILRLNVIP